MAPEKNPSINKIEKTSAEWRELLTPEQYHILREAGTEHPSLGNIGTCKMMGPAARAVGRCYSPRRRSSMRAVAGPRSTTLILQPLRHWRISAMACTGSRSDAVAAAAISGMSSTMAPDRPASAIASTLPASTLCEPTRLRDIGKTQRGHDVGRPALPAKAPRQGVSVALGRAATTCGTIMHRKGTSHDCETTVWTHWTLEHGHALGAAALSRATQAEADRVLDILLEYGVNHIDVAARYGDAELRIGPWMARHRQEFFLATKTGKRLYQDARDEIHRSLERLRVDVVDLIQLHALFHPDDWDLAMGPGGALEAAIEAREQGLVRFIGVTGHGWTIAAMHKRSLERFDFDSILLPYNCHIMHQNEHYREDFDAVVRSVKNGRSPFRPSKPLRAGRGPRPRKRAIPGISPWKNRRTLIGPCTSHGRPAGIFLNTAGDIQLLPKILDAASRYDTRPSDDAMTAMLEKQCMTTLFGLGPASIR